MFWELKRELKSGPLLVNPEHLWKYSIPGVQHRAVQELEVNVPRDANSVNDGHRIFNQWLNNWINYSLSGRSLEWDAAWLTHVCVGVKWRWYKSQPLPSPALTPLVITIILHTACLFLQDILHAVLCMWLMWFITSTTTFPPRSAIFKSIVHTAVLLCTRLNLLPRHDFFISSPLLLLLSYDIWVFRCCAEGWQSFTSQSAHFKWGTLQRKQALCMEICFLSAITHSQNDVCCPGGVYSCLQAWVHRVEESCLLITAGGCFSQITWALLFKAGKQLQVFWHLRRQKMFFSSD